MKLAVVTLVLFVTIIGVICTDEVVNKSRSLGGIWSTADDEGELLAWNVPEADGARAADEDERRQLDGGFSSLEGMLQWAIGHSDPEKLKESVSNVQKLSPEDLKQRQMELKELVEKLKMPSDADLMKVAINDLNNLSLSVEDRRRALHELLILVEPIDNANDLHKLGGLAAVIRELKAANEEIRTTAAWVLGKASQNNHVVQKQILDLGTLPRLIEMSHSEFVEEATKSLYAISALIRNNLYGQDLFYKEGGDFMLQNILSNSSIDVRLRRKSVFLLADLIEAQLENRRNEELPFFSSHMLLKSVVDLLSSTDLDLQEKALYAVKNLLLVSNNAVVFDDVFKLGIALEKMKQQLEQLIVEGEFKEYAEDVENLRSEVELIYLQELDKGQSVPT